MKTLAERINELPPELQREVEDFVESLIEKRVRKGKGKPKLDTLHLLYGYNRWVNRRLLATAEGLAPERTRERLGASFDTVHGTLAHILAAEVNWLDRWRGATGAKRLGGDDFEDLAAIRSRWLEHERELEAFLAELTPERLAAPLRYVDRMGKSYELPLGPMMLHVVNHGTHHRSELADMLTRLGHEPDPTDLVRYCLAETGQE